MTSPNTKMFSMQQMMQPGLCCLLSLPSVLKKSVHCRAWSFTSCHTIASDPHMTSVIMGYPLITLASEGTVGVEPIQILTKTI